MATFTEDFTNFVKWRVDGIADGERIEDIYEELEGISKKAADLGFDIELIASEAGYQLGFRDGIDFMAGGARWI